MNRGDPHPTRAVVCTKCHAVHRLPTGEGKCPVCSAPVRERDA